MKSGSGGRTHDTQTELEGGLFILVLTLLYLGCHRPNTRKKKSKQNNTSPTKQKNSPCSRKSDKAVRNWALHFKK